MVMGLRKQLKAQTELQQMLRDQYRNPHDTLTFFGIKDDMVVVELSPGSGW